MHRLSTVPLLRIRSAFARAATRLTACSLLALLSGACTAEKLFAVEEGGQSLWQRVETEHFVVESDMQRTEKLRAVASDFETLWHAFASVPVLGRRPPKTKPLVVLLQSESEYRYLAGPRTAGLFIAGTALGSVILMPPNSRPFRDFVIKQELAFFVASGFLPNPPSWLSEGLGLVMETASYDSEAGEILFGGFLRGRVDAAELSLPAEFFMGEWPDSMTSLEAPKYYAKSWLLVHYLIDDHLQEFLDFLKKLSGGQAWRSAWDDEFSLSFDEVDAALSRYRQQAKYGLWKVAAQRPDMGAFKEAVVPVADVFALRSVLQACAINPERQRLVNIEAAQRDLQSALDLDPQSARVQTIRAAASRAAPRTPEGG